jgi:predicted amidophosphoribosyltransferase
MAKKFIRFYKNCDLPELKTHLLISGDLSSSCANCQKIDLKWEQSQCPQCGTEFKFIAFRQVKSNWPKIQKISAERPQMQIVDYDDYKRSLGASKAEEFFK